MRYPDFLKQNGTIGFIAPSFGCATEPYKTRFEHAVEKFGNMGYKTILGPNAEACEGIGKSNTPEKCGEETNDFFINDKCDVILSCGGGETMCEDLPFVDFAGIAKATPKWYMGYSDNTNYTFLLNVLCDTASIYAPCAGDFGMNPWHESIEDAYNLLTGKTLTFQNYDGWEYEEEIEEQMRPDQYGEYIIDSSIEEYMLAPYEINKPYKQLLYKGREEVDGLNFSGRLIGGCLDCLQILTGTVFDKVEEYLEKYKNDGFVWFIESCDLNVMSVRRALWQLDNAGWFKYVKGFIIGRPRKIYDEFDGFGMHDAITEMLGKFGVPIVMDADIGHRAPMIPIMSGSIGQISAQGNKLEITYKLG